MLAIIDSNKFNYKNKIGEFKYIDIKDLVNNIKNNTISEISAKKSLNTLNEIKNTEIIKYKKRTTGRKELLNLFNDLLDAILTNKTLELKSRKNDENENDNENENENDETLMSSKYENEKQSEFLNNDNNANAKDENQNMLLEYMEDVDEKLFKEYSNGKYFNSFINEFDRAKNKEDKEKVVKELKRQIFLLLKMTSK